MELKLRRGPSDKRSPFWSASIARRGVLPAVRWSTFDVWLQPTRYHVPTCKGRRQVDIYEIPPHTFVRGSARHCAAIASALACHGGRRTKAPFACRIGAWPPHGRAGYI